jgi:hypothetical protein
LRREWPRDEAIRSENDGFERLTEQLVRGALDLAFARHAGSEMRHLSSAAVVALTV